MDPVTLFAIANGAVSAVKAGCKLYRDIKGAAGEVRDVLKDMDEQFKKLHPPEKPATQEQRNAFVKQRNEVVELNKKANAGQHTDVYQQIGEELGKYYDNYYKCRAIFDEEEKRAKNEVYSGDASLGKRALQRILMRKQLEEMGRELREIMVYQSPPELGALYTEVSDMMEKMGAEQQVLIARQMKAEFLAQKKRRELMDKYMIEAMGAIAVIAAIAIMSAGLAVVVEDRIKKYPHLGTEWIPKTEAQRQEEARPKVYTGR